MSRVGGLGFVLENGLQVVFACFEKSRHDESQQRSKLAKVVLQRGSCKKNSEPSRNASKSLIFQGFAVPQNMCFVVDTNLTTLLEIRWW